MTAKCTLRVSSDRTPAREIVQALGLRAVRVYEVGEPVSARSMTRRDRSMALFETGLSVESPLEEHLAEIATIVRSHAAILQRLRATCDIDIFAMYASESGQGSCSLAPVLLRTLADLELPITIDLYPPTRDT